MTSASLLAANEPLLAKAIQGHPITNQRRASEAAVYLDVSGFVRGSGLTLRKGRC